MAEQNPIKYSDLISPDDSIEKLIGQLETLQKTYEGVTQSVRDRAAAMAASLKAVSGATEEGRQSTRGASQEADRLTKAYEALNFARSETAHKIAELKEQQKQEQMITKLNVQLNNSAAGSYNALSAQYRLNKIALNNLTAEERENIPYAKKLEEETKKIYEEMDRLQRATGKYTLNVGNYENAINRAIGVNSKWFNSLQMLAGLFQGGLTSGIKTAGTAVAGFGRQLLALLANPIVATIAAITAAFMALAKGISTSEENTNTLMRVLAPFKRILEGVVNVLQTAVGFVLKVVEGFENMAMGAAKLMERLPLVGGAIAKVNRALETNIALERERQQLQKDGRELTKKEAKTQYEIAVLRRKAQQTDDPKMRQAYLEKAVRKENQMAADRVAYIQRELNALKEKSKESQNDSAINDQIAQKEAELWNARTEAERKNYRLIGQIESAKRKAAGTTGGGGGKSTAVNTAEQEAKERERLQKEAQKKELAAIRQSEDAKVALIENGYDRERAETILSYDRHIEDLKAQLAEEANLTEEAKKAMNDTIISLEQQKWNKLAEIADKEMKAAVDAETKDAQERIKKAEKLAEEAKKKREKRLDLYDILGFNLTEEKKQAIDEAVTYAMDSLNHFMDVWTAAADARREAADAEVERTQRVLEAEIDARNAGYANDVETARKELNEAKKNQQKAMQQQQTAHRAQIALDTATQASSLITATANIWKSFTQLGPWGIAGAIAATALMWGAFASAKIMAFQAAGMDTEKYSEGTVELLHGGSHQSGNDIDLGRKKDGTRRRAEGGEYFAVINKRSSKKYGNLIPDIINSLNRDTFAEKYMGAYDGAGVSVTVNGRNPDLKELTQSVNDIRDQGRTRTYMDGGNTVMVYKNLKRVVRNGN